MTIVKIPHQPSYSSPRDVYARRTEDGGLALCGIGYYEEDLMLTREQLAQLGLVDVPPSEPKP